MNNVSEFEEEFTRQAMERRLEQTDGVIAKLYEDKVMGKITSEMFAKLSAKYIAEQEEQTAALDKARKELSAIKAKKTDVTRFVALVRKYSPSAC